MGDEKRREPVCNIWNDNDGRIFSSRHKEQPEWTKHPWVKEGEENAHRDRME
jgi:1,2-phenylacetyl-CoA epoxidase PaaB subunit